MLIVRYVFTGYSGTADLFMPVPRLCSPLLNNPPTFFARFVGFVRVFHPQGLMGSLVTLIRGRTVGHWVRG